MYTLRSFTNYISVYYDDISANFGVEKIHFNWVEEMKKALNIFNQKVQNFASKLNNENYKEKSISFIGSKWKIVSSTNINEPWKFKLDYTVKIKTSF